MKRMFSNLPDVIKASDIQMPKVLPEHTELISKAKALVAPNSCCTRVAVAGCMRSGDDVDSTMPWMRSAGKSTFCRQQRAALMAKSEVHSSSGAILLDRTPVFSAMSFMEEAGKWVKASLGTTDSGRWLPVEKITDFFISSSRALLLKNWCANPCEFNVLQCE